MFVSRCAYLRGSTQQTSPEWKKVNVALSFAGQFLASNKLRLVVFETRADPCLTASTFVDIQRFCRIGDKEEMIFNPNSRFRIGSIACPLTVDVWLAKTSARDKGAHLVGFCYSSSIQIDQVGENFRCYSSQIWKISLWVTITFWSKHANTDYYPIISFFNVVY